MIKTKKLTFSAVTVRQLTQNMTEDELRGVAGGTIINVQPQLMTSIPNGAVPTGGPRTLTGACPSIGQTLGAC